MSFATGFSIGSAQPDAMLLKIRLSRASSRKGGTEIMTLNRAATFGDLRAILKAKFESVDSVGSQWIFFRERDRAQVGVNNWDVVVGSISENQDVLIIQEVTMWNSGTSIGYGGGTGASLSLWNCFGSKNKTRDVVLCDVNQGAVMVKQDVRGPSYREDEVFDHQIHEAIRRSKLKSPPNYSPNYTPSSGGSISMHCAPSVLPPPLPLNDTAGRLVSQASISQYTMDGGRSACTSICFVACFELLCELDDVALGNISSAKLDSMVRKGVQGYKNLQSKHSSIEELWNLSSFSTMAPQMKGGPTKQGSVASRQDLIDAFQASLDFALDSDRLAVVLTKSGETVLCVADLQSNGAASRKWYLFDSHGQSHETNKLAYWKQYGSIHELLGAFLTKYPPQDFGDGSFQSDMYNLFESVPIVRRRDVIGVMPTEGPRSVHLQIEDNRGKSPDSSHAPVGANDSTDSPAPPKLPSALKAQAPPANGAHRSSHFPPGMFDIENFQCAILPEIMADPVVCSDGHVYDRPNIERHFETRREQEKERIDQELARARGERSPEENADDCCGCGAARPPIVLTSPKTNEVVDGFLTPVLLVDKQIQDLMSQNYFSLSEEDVADWHTRREEKKKRDTERAAEQREQQQRQAEMQRNAEEAAAKRAEEGLEEQQRFPPLPQELAMQVRVERDTNDRAERLGEDDLGISVALADKVHRIPASYGLQGARYPRCMVACCAVELRSNQWCARCARLICNDCLGFGVSNIATTSSPDSNLSRICFECASQVVDAMESPDIRVRQKRAVLISALEKYLTQLSNRAATKQADVVRHQTHDEYGSRMEEAEQAIRELEGQLQDVQARVREQTRLANIAKADTSGTGDDSDLEALMERVRDLQTQYEECLQQKEEDDDELGRVLRRTDLASKLEDAQASLVIAQSSVPANPLPTGEAAHEGTHSQLERLGQRLEELSSFTGAETEEEQIGRVMEMSELNSQIDELGLRLALERSEQTPDKQSPTATTSARFPSVQALVESVGASPRNLRRKRGFRIRFRGSNETGKRERSDAVERVVTSCNLLVESPTVENAVVALSNIGELLPRMDDARLGLSEEAKIFLMAAHAEIESDPETLRARKSDPPAGNRAEADESSIESDGSGGDGEEDILVEYLRLSARRDISSLDPEEQLKHISRLSELDAILRVAEAQVLQNQQAEVPSRDSVVQARHDLGAIGSRLTAWPLPLGLEFPTPRMERQLEVLRSTLELRQVESKRSAEAHMTEQHDALGRRREELEDEIAQAQRNLADAEEHAREEEQRRLERREERRRREDEARQAREQALREEARRAQEAAEALRVQHERDEAATTQAFARAGGAGGAAAMGGAGDFRMCLRCRAGPVENMACKDLSAHNDTSTSYNGRIVASVANPNACRHCGWFNGDWHAWPYWDGVFGPH